MDDAQSHIFKEKKKPAQPTKKTPKSKPNSISILFLVTLLYFSSLVEDE